MIPIDTLSPVLLAAAPDAAAPDWVHLLPAGEIATRDGRGPYSVADAAALIAASMAEGRLAIDENHSTDLAAPKGLPAPARGWIVEMQARDDGVWGRVEWAASGAQLLAERAYRALSPVILHDKAKRIVRILRASLVNAPNLRGLAALNLETPMDLTARLAQALGLADPDDDAILHAVEALQARPEPQADTSVVAALQAELAGVTAQLAELRQAGARARAEASVDAAIRAGKPGVKVLRDHYVARHMADAAAVETELAALPQIAGGAVLPATPPVRDGEVALNAQQLGLCRQLGIDPVKYAATLKAERLAEETL